MSIRKIAALVIGGLLVGVVSGAGTAFHVDPLQGDDSADGLSPAHAWKTWKRFTAVARPGSSLLLKRGCVYALPLPVVAGDSQAPIVYGAYGEGPKPVLEGHIVDLAKPELWKQDGTDIWETDKSVPEVANVIFDDVHCGNMRYSKEELRQKGEWFQDPSGKGPLFIYATENPAKAWRKVELIAAGYGQVLAGKECTYIRLENLVFRKIGTHGIWIKSGASDISIRRCDLTLIGGAIFRADEFSKKYGERFVQRRVRFGNAIETWGDASNIMVEGCRIYDIFDGGFDIQGVDGVVSNIVVRNNIFWNCGYDSLDIAHGVRPDNVVFEQNTCWNGGEGWALQGEPRPRYSLNVPDQLGYLCNLENSYGWKDGSISIRKNIFCNAPDSRCFNFGPKPPTGMHLIKVDQNCYFQVNPKDALVQLGAKRFTATEFDAYRKTTGWDTRSVVGDPQFVAPALGDFRLKPDSPAQGLGSQMSLQPE